jgi:hypothetical protein
LAQFLRIFSPLQYISAALMCHLRLTQLNIGKKLALAIAQLPRWGKRFSFVFIAK